MPNNMELTPSQKIKVEKLIHQCANYFEEYDVCLPTDMPCKMFRVWKTGGWICEYFQNAVLPLDPITESLLLQGKKTDMKLCIICNTKFPQNGKQKYCSEDCKKEGNKRQSRKRMQNMRNKRR